MFDNVFKQRSYPRKRTYPCGCEKDHNVMIYCDMHNKQVDQYGLLRL